MNLLKSLAAAVLSLSAFGASAAEYTFTLTSNAAPPLPVVVRVADPLAVVARQMLLAGDVSQALVAQLSDPQRLASFGAAAAIVTTPEIAICAKGEMPMTGRAFLITPRNSAPSTAPATEPMPPAMEMPPMTFAATLSSSKPAAIST